MKFSQLKLPNLGVLQTQIPDDVLKNIHKQIHSPYISNIDNSYNNRLVGQMKGEFEFTITEDFENFLKEFYSHYVETFNLIKRKVVGLDAWANFQQATEYNPVHLHEAEASWVLWIKIPYKLEEEDNLPNSRMSYHHTNSRFQFVYSRIDGLIQTHDLAVDSDWEGTIIIFPSLLRHCVYPFFTSDESRISIAGNIHATQW